MPIENDSQDNDAIFDVVGHVNEYNQKAFKEGSYQMLEKITVYAWVKMKTVPEYTWKTVWGGKSLIKAIWHAWIAKAYSGCVKIEWRGTR